MLQSASHRSWDAMNPGKATVGSRAGISRRAIGPVRLTALAILIGLSADAARAQDSILGDGSHCGRNIRPALEQHFADLGFDSLDLFGASDDRAPFEPPCEGPICSGRQAPLEPISPTTPNPPTPDPWAAWGFEPESRPSASSLRPVSSTTPTPRDLTAGLFRPPRSADLTA